MRVGKMEASVLAKKKRLQDREEPNRSRKEVTKH